MRWRGPAFGGWLLVPALLLPACADGPGAGSAEEPAATSSPEAIAEAPGGAEAPSPEVQDPVRPERIESDLTRGDTVPGWPSWTRQDRDVLVATVAWAHGEGLDSLAMGERVARIGQRFVGAPYVPQTLDPPGPERLVVNLRAFDCVTFVESVLTLAHVVGRSPAAATAPDDLMAAYEEVLTELRYRGGSLVGYPSRLHYFSEWIADNEAKGFVENVTAELGGVPDPEAPTFMSEHRDAYRQLGDPAVFDAILEVEASLADLPRFVIPEARVLEIEGRIRSGDVIAATSALPGLDVAHTGIALRQDGILRLMHAPLVGEAVQISDISVGQRLARLNAQDGIMVARPLPAGRAGSPPPPRK